MQPQDTTRTIPLTKGYEAIVDAADYEWLSQYKWHASVNNKTGHVYARRRAKVDGKWRHIRMHRMITDAPDDMVVDHINRNTMDNRRCNLRVVNTRANVMNTGPGKSNTSGYKGVSQCSWSGKWRARITAPDGRRVDLGRFDYPEHAAEAYDKAAVEMGVTHGLNFPVQTWTKSETIPYLWTKVSRR